MENMAHGVQARRMNQYAQDIAIHGNGIIGCLAALACADAGMKVALIGPDARPNAASTAAGAMLNVYGEIDGPLDDYGRRKLEIGLRAIKMWREFAPAELFVADRTEIYHHDRATQFEKTCFEAIAKEASGGKYGRILLPGAPWKIHLENEPAVNTPALFEWLHSQLRNKVRLIPSASSQFDFVASAPKQVYCAGAWTREAMGSLGEQILPLYFGVGTAMVLAGAKIDIPPRTVVRTPNRGNTCGVHVVPRGDNQLYVGAGSFISRSPVPGPRLETIKYLTDCLQADLGADVWRATVAPVVGFRPMSFDGKPMLGPLRGHPDTYVATGTKRDGLTYAPVIAEDICNWATGKPRSGVFDGWEPDREPISYGTIEQACQAYVENKTAAEAEHGRVADKQALWAKALAAHAGRPYGLHPEIIGVL